MKLNNLHHNDAQTHQQINVHIRQHVRTVIIQLGRDVAVLLHSQWPHYQPTNHGGQVSHRMLICHRDSCRFHWRDVLPPHQRLNVDQAESTLAVQFGQDDRRHWRRSCWSSLGRRSTVHDLASLSAHQTTQNCRNHITCTQHFTTVEKQTDGQTDTAWHHRPCLCIASRGKT